MPLAAAAAARVQRTVTRPLPQVLVVHTGGTLGMDPSTSFLPDERGKSQLAPGTGGNYEGGLRPGEASPQAQASRKQGVYHAGCARGG